LLPCVHSGFPEFGTLEASTTDQEKYIYLEEENILKLSTNHCLEIDLSVGLKTIWFIHVIQAIIIKVTEDMKEFDDRDNAEFL
jgi:hypothetical protein